MSVFLGGALGKRYTNFSSDIISVLTGLDNVDQVFTDFIASLDACIRSGQKGKLLALKAVFYAKSFRLVEVRRKAIQLALCISSGAFQTSVLSYFTHRDLFPALMKVLATYSNKTTTDTQPQFTNDPDAVGLAYEPFLLLGILANCKRLPAR